MRHLRWLGLVAGIGLSGCGDGLGACVSEPVDLAFGLVVYCYDGWDRSDCNANDDQRVNGADWEFHGGQECEDRDLETGSNDWP